MSMPNWSELRKVIPKGEVLLPDDAGYAASVRRWSAAAEIRSTVVVRPTCATEVSEAVQFAISNELPLTVCGGGHSSSGTSSSEGMVIHLGNMRQVSVDEPSMTVTFDGGCLWADVDSALDPRGLCTIGGAVNHTGVGGLILGGGHGWLTAKHGLTIDDLISVQIVTADGRILEASETQNADLFWAMRGAGAQFGVVTRFTSRVHNQGLVWSGVLAFAPEKLSKVVEFVNEFHSRDNREGHCLALSIGHELGGTGRILSIIPLYHGPENDARQYFSSLLSIEPIADQTTMMSIAQLNTLANPMCEYGIRRLQGSSNVTMPLDATELQHTANMLWEFHTAHTGIEVCVLTIEVFSTRRLREMPQNATAYANRGDYYDAVTNFGWIDATIDYTVRRFNRALCDRVRLTNGRSYSQGGDVGVGRYLNMEVERLRPEEAYGSNLERLQRLKKRFDPNNVFHKWHGVGVSSTEEVHEIAEDVSYQGNARKVR